MSGRQLARMALGLAAPGAITNGHRLGDVVPFALVPWHNLEDADAVNYIGADFFAEHPQYRPSLSLPEEVRQFLHPRDARAWRFQLTTVRARTLCYANETVRNYLDWTRRALRGQSIREIMNTPEAIPHYLREEAGIESVLRDNIASVQTQMQLMRTTGYYPPVVVLEPEMLDIVDGYHRSAAACIELGEDAMVTVWRLLVEKRV